MDGVTSVIQNIQAWLSHPFSTKMGLKGWFAFTGLVLVAVIIWILILRELKENI